MHPPTTSPSWIVSYLFNPGTVAHAGTCGRLQVTKKQQEVERSTGKAASADAEAEAALMARGMTTGSLADAVDSLPALLNRKKNLNMHLAILGGVMARVAARNVPVYFEVEQSIATGSAVSRCCQPQRWLRCSVSCRLCPHSSRVLLVIHAMRCRTRRLSLIL